MSNAFAILLGVATLPAVGVLLVRDVCPRWFPPRAHDLLASVPLASIAVAYIAHQYGRRLDMLGLVTSVTLAAAFLFWAANQLWPDLPQATLFNDVAIALFVIDVFLTIVGRYQ